MSVDPQFANAAAADFHLKTQTPAGRYDPATETWVSDPVTSQLIDSGDPASPYASEPSPNGGRVDIGQFGNSAEASIGRSTPWLYAASYQEGGAARGVSVFRWVAGNLATDATVRVEYSTDGGLAYVTLTTGVLASVGQVSFDTATTSDTPSAVWRVTSTSDPGLTDATTNFFAIRNASLALYLNDGSTAGDIYASAAGASTNYMASAARPYHSLAEALRRYDLEPGDVVYLDTGYYGMRPAPMPCSGSTMPGAAARRCGSWAAPTRAAGGTILDRGSTSAGSFGLQFTRARDVTVSNLILRGANTGVSVDNSRDMTLTVIAQGATSNGFSVSQSTNITFSRSASVHNAGRGLRAFQSVNTRVLRSALWSNTLGAVYVSGGTVAITDSVLTVQGSGRYLMEVESLREGGERVQQPAGRRPGPGRLVQRAGPALLLQLALRRLQRFAQPRTCA